MILNNGNILIISDDENYASILRNYLKENHNIVDTALDGYTARKKLKEKIYAAVLLDITLPGENGLDLCRGIRKNNKLIPIIVLSNKNNDVERIASMEHGADYLMEKPCNIKELFACMKNLTQRASFSEQYLQANNKAEEDQYIPFGKIQIEPERRYIKKGSQHIPITRTELEILLYFYEMPNQLLSREMLLSRVQKRKFEIYDRSVDVHVGKIRKKIEPIPSTPKYIITEWGNGYRYVPMGIDEE